MLSCGLTVICREADRTSACLRNPDIQAIVTRRSLLASAALLIMTSGVSARVVTKVLPWQPNEAYPVPPVIPGGYLFFTPAEAATVDAIVDRLIPTDELGPGAKESRRHHLHRPATHRAVWRA